MSDFTDALLAVFTVVLAGATIVLAWNTGRLVRVTKETSQSSQSLGIMPALTVVSDAWGQDKRGVECRFAVKNIGYGTAKNPVAIVIGDDGIEYPIEAHTTTNAVEVGGLYYWDAYGLDGVKQLLVEVRFTDLRDNPCQPMKHKIMTPMQ